MSASQSALSPSLSLSRAFDDRSVPSQCRRGVVFYAGEIKRRVMEKLQSKKNVRAL